MNKANIKVDKKAGAGAVTSIDNSIDDGGKVTDWHAGLINLAIAALATANYARNFNLAIFKETPLGIATFTLNKFFATFAALTNTTLKRKPKMYKSNLFLFTANYQ